MKKLMFTIALLLVTIGTVLAQSGQVSGLVTDANDGSPLPGVSVSVKGTTTGTITDAEGRYSVRVSGGQTLVFSFVGCKTQEFRINNQAVIDAVMEPDVVSMDEVLVVAYGTTRRSSYTGSAQKVAADQLSASRGESLEKTLSGKATGVRVTSATGDPGSSGDIQIRGIGSITGTTTPLYIVDGVPIVTGKFGNSGISSNVLSSISPQDIESLTVLKDAAAASLYGSRAANGVVIITTKKGREGTTKLNFSASYGISEIATDSYKQMSGPEYIEYERAAILGYRLRALDALVPGGANYGNPEVLAQAETWVTENLSDWSLVDDPEVDTDWWSAIYGKGYDREYQLSASGGNEKASFYTGLGYKDVDGIVAMYGFKRYTGTINIESSLRKWIDISFNTMLSYTDQTGRTDQSGQSQGINTASPLSLIMAGNPTSRIYNDDGSLNLNASFDTRVKNSLYALLPEQSYTNNKTYRVISSGAASVKFSDQFSFKSTNAVDFFTVEGFRRWSPASIDGASLNGLGERPTNLTSQLTTSNLLTFNDTFGTHSISAIAGFEAQLYNNTSIFTSASNYSTDKLEELSVGQPRVAYSNKFGRYLQSWLANVNYNIAEKYYLAGSIRFDESSQLGIDKRRALFYSASASWRFSNESFIASDWLSDGKLRFSYGTNGNLPGNSYDHYGLYDFGGIYGPESAIYLSQPENKNLGWEMSHNMNVGTDLTLFDRITLSAEYFYKYTRDLLLSVPTSYATGFSEALQNSGEISNRGIEAELHISDLLRSKLVWNIDLSVSTLKSTVEKLPGGKDILLGDGNHYIYREGGDLYTFYLPVWHDVDPECGLARFLIDPELPATEENFTYYYSAAKRGPVAKAYPDLMGGFNNSFSIGGFSLNVLVTYQFGGNMFDYPGYFQKNHGIRHGTWNYAKEVAENYWKKPGDVAKYPRPVVFWSARPDRWSTLHILSTDFIRLKELSLSYRIPKSLTNRIGIENLTVTGSSNNLALLYQAEKHVDPEVSLNGYRTVDTPLARTYTLGFNIDF